jgi:hypothetical protein
VRLFLLDPSNCTAPCPLELIVQTNLHLAQRPSSGVPWFMIVMVRIWTPERNAIASQVCYVVHPTDAQPQTLRPAASARSNNSLKHNNPLPPKPGRAPYMM